MKNLVKLVVIVCALALSSCAKEKSIPMQVNEQLGFGWNLGNHFDSFKFFEGATPATANYWDSGCTPTEELYKNLVKAGVKTVRIPITWGDWQSAYPEYTIDPDFMALIQQNVQWAKNAGLNVIINMHHDEYWLDIYHAAQNDSLKDAISYRIIRSWEQIAKAFAEEGDYLFMEPFNEIHAVNDEGVHDWSGTWCLENDGKMLKIMNEWTEIAVKTIRATGGKNATRWLVVTGYAANPELTMSHLVIPDDEANRIMVAVHSYSPCDFTLEDKVETWGLGENKERDEQEIVNLFAALKETFINKGIPCYLGEFGCDAHATEEGEACRLRYLTMFASEAHKAGVAPILWDNSYEGAGAEKHAYFNHNDGTIVAGAEKIVDALVNVCK